jgi:hypothetical protein
MIESCALIAGIIVFIDREIRLDVKWKRYLNDC